MEKTIEQVDAIMESIWLPFRYRWCGGENGPCACLGCVQICSRELMYKKQTGMECRIDPEHLPLGAFSPEIREACTITREDWEAWVERHPQPESEKPQYGVVWKRCGELPEQGGDDGKPL